MKAMLDIRGLSAAYAPGEPAITGVELAVSGGRLVAVLGPNGGGKTTLFRALLGEVPHRSGDVRITGDIAYVPQTERARLDFPIDALGVALMGAYPRVPWYRRLGAAEREAARAALARVGLETEASTPFGELSGGQRQRVLIARALTRDASLLLLDEPLSGVDRPSADRILALLGELRDEGRILLVSTHDIEQSRGFDDVLCLNRRQVAFGPPSAVCDPATLAQTYGAELVRLDDGSVAAVVQHHDHAH